MLRPRVSNLVFGRSLKLLIQGAICIKNISIGFLKLPNRHKDYQGNQLVLNLPNPKIADYVYHIVIGLIDKNPGLDYIKWGCNRTMDNPFSHT